MKKNFIIASLLVITCLSLIFGFQQKMRADKAKAQIEHATMQAEKALKNAQEQTELAQQHARAAAMKLKEEN